MSQYHNSESFSYDEPMGLAVKPVQRDYTNSANDALLLSMTSNEQPPETDALESHHDAIFNPTL